MEQKNRISVLIIKNPAKLDVPLLVPSFWYNIFNISKERNLNNMKRESINDMCNRIIGYIQYEDNGDQVLYSKNNVRLGIYRVSVDMTFDNRNIRVGYGNVLMRLLK